MTSPLRTKNRAVLVALLVSSTLACGTTSRQERKKTPMEQLVRDFGSHDDVTISITTGTEHFGKGLVKLSIRGDGNVTITNHMAGKKREFTGKLTSAEIAEIGKELADAGFTTLRSPGPPRKPGDTPLVLEITQGGEERYHGDLWYGDRYTMPGVDAIIRRNDEIVTRLTDGELPY